MEKNRHSAVCTSCSVLEEVPSQVVSPLSNWGIGMSFCNCAVPGCRTRSIACHSHTRTRMGIKRDTISVHSKVPRVSELHVRWRNDSSAIAIDVLRGASLPERCCSGMSAEQKVMPDYLISDRRMTPRHRCSQAESGEEKENLGKWKCTDEGGSGDDLPGTPLGYFDQSAQIIFLFFFFFFFFPFCRLSFPFLLFSVFLFIIFLDLRHSAWGTALYLFRFGFLGRLLGRSIS